MKLRKRRVASIWTKLGIAALSICLAILITSIMLILMGFNPANIYWRLFVGAFGTASGLLRTVTKTIPLLLVSLGLAIAFRAKAWNIGAPGQMAIGAIAGGGVALFLLPNLPPYLLIPLIFIAGFLSGAGLAAICAILNDKIGLDMVISTLLLNYVMFKLLNYLLYGPWQTEAAFPYTETIPTSAQLPTLAGTDFHYPTLILGIVTMGALYVFLTRSSWGYEIRVFGENPQASDYAGISSFKVLVLVMMISGGLAGLAGAGEVMGVHHMLRKGITGAGAVYAASYGYTAIFIAWLGRNHPIGVGLASFFVAGILVGGQNLQAEVAGLPYAMVSVILGLMLLLLIAGEFLIRHRIEFGGG
ncbi:hypothetical protein AKJ47_01485 [candidate division MSBL1 archaeon SCGC-AAA261G05]|uniref:ABC transporter permease n=2 Tax=candidate division MSBL1 TaxID=215777 RepID=A0A133V1E5_9EURY|nr:hypothetical protein AKJ42_01310 [candidate division MSBL1 archaeon SCGC-AAA261C02]KXB03924.1 hypothetical protein AKJ47_01485 [candidate division MSBL1 archaeon SCGC-AAA261G05]